MESKNKVTQEDISCLMEKSKIDYFKAFDKVTIVSMQLPNGFVITESSACVDPKNFDMDLGISICKKRIEDRLWELEGYLLQDKLNKK